MNTGILTPESVCLINMLLTVRKLENMSCYRKTDHLIRISVGILQRNRTDRIYTDICKEEIYYRNWLMPLWRLRWPMICRAHNVSPGPSLKAREPGAPILQNRRRRMLQLKKRENLPLLSFFVLLRSLNELNDAHPIGEGRFSLLSLLIQMLISSLNTLTDTPSNNVLPDI